MPRSDRFQKAWCSACGLSETQSQLGESARGLGSEHAQVVVGALGLRDLAVRGGLAGVDHVGELNALVHEEYWYVVADELRASARRGATQSHIPVAVIGCDGQRRRESPETHCRT